MWRKLWEKIRGRVRHDDDDTREIVFPASIYYGEREVLNRLSLTKEQYDRIDGILCTLEITEAELRERIEAREGEYLDLFLFMRPEQQDAWRKKAKDRMIEIAESRRKPKS
jgi:hypothetical protein